MTEQEFINLMEQHPVPFVIGFLGVAGAFILAIVLIALKQRGHADSRLGLPWYFWAVPVGLLVLAPMNDWPYGYYTFLRIVCCLATGYLAVLEFRRQEQLTKWAMVMGCLCILFNPVILIELDRDTWAWVDIGSAMALGVHGIRSSGSVPSSKPSEVRVAIGDEISAAEKSRGDSE